MRHLIATVLLLVSVTAVSTSAQWTRVTDLPAVEMLSFIVHENIMYAGANGMIYTSADAGQTWDTSEAIPDNTTEVSALAIFDDNLYTGSFGTGVHVSADTGKTWSAVNDGLTGTGAYLITALAPRGDSLYVGTSGAGIFVLPKGGTTWAPFNDGLSWNYSYEILSINNIADRLIAGGGISATYYVNDRDTSGWRELVLGPLPPLGLGLLDVVTLGGNLYAGGTDGLYLSRNYGESFEATHPSAAYISDAHATVFDTTVYIALVFSGGTVLYTNTSSGSEWVHHSTQLGVLAFDIEAHAGRLYEARLDGLWYLPLTPTAVEPNPGSGLPSSVDLAQNYPNPFNASTVISYSLPDRSRVTIDIFNISGQTIRRLVDESQPAGPYQISWDGLTDTGQPAASGVYFYRLSTDAFESSRKMLLLK